MSLSGFCRDTFVNVHVCHVFVKGMCSIAVWWLGQQQLALDPGAIFPRTGSLAKMVGTEK